MARKTKLYAQLDEMEANLRTRLIAAARAAAAGSNDLLFVVTDLNPFPGHVCPSRSTEALVALGEETLKLRGNLGESLESAPATLFRRYCEQWSKTSDHHRGTCATLARRLLADLDVLAEQAAAGRRPGESRA